MEIDRNFSLYGFEKKDFGPGGCAFFRWEEPKEEGRAPTIREESYGGYYGMKYYNIGIPKPPTKKLTGAVLITRQSKNRYSLSMQSEKGVQIIPLATSLSAIREQVNEFFKGGGRMNDIEWVSLVMSMAALFFAVAAFSYVISQEVRRRRENKKIIHYQEILHRASLRGLPKNYWGDIGGDE